MNANVFRQIKDIQYQADKLFNNTSTTIDIENFAKYSDELKQYLLKNVDEAEILKHIHLIPEIRENAINVKKGIISLIIPTFLMHWYHERSYVEESKNTIHQIKGKYASIEFLLKNYYN